MRGTILLLAGLVLSAPSAADIERIRLTGRLYQRPTCSGTRNTVHLAGDRVVYVADEVGSPAYEVWTWSMADPAPRLLLEEPVGDAPGFILSPDGRWLTYQDLSAQLDVRGSPPVMNLWSVPTDSRRAPRRLSRHPQGNDLWVVDWLFSPDGKRVLFDFRNDLYSARTDGTGTATRLDPAGVIVGLGFERQAVTPDSAFVVYTGGVQSRFALLRTPIGGGDTVELIEYGDGYPGIVKITPDGGHVVVTWGVDPPDRAALNAVPIDGGPLRMLHPPIEGPTFESAVEHFLLSPDSDTVMFTAFALEGPLRWAGYRTTISAATAILLPEPVPPSTEMQFTPDGQWVVFGNGGVFKVRPDGSELTRLAPSGSDLIATDTHVVFSSAGDVRSAHLDRRGDVRLNPPKPTSTPPLRYGVLPGAHDVVYWGDLNGDGRDELFTVPIGGGPSTRLSPDLADEPVGCVWIHPSRPVVGFTMAEGEQTALYVVVIDDSPESAKPWPSASPPR